MITFSTSISIPPPDIPSHRIIPAHCPANMGTEALRYPLPSKAQISSPYGYRIDPFGRGRRMHTGIDLAAPTGTPILAAHGGRVVLARDYGGYGLAVILEAENGQLRTLYGHMSRILVAANSAVSSGDTIGLVGSTGRSTGPHLHFEKHQRIGQRWVRVNPSEIVREESEAGRIAPSTC